MTMHNEIVVAIHQPNFFPWIGYFDKIAHCNYFVFLDDVQYSNGTMTNRAYITNNKKTTYITCPVSYHHPSKIKDVMIADTPWREKTIRTIKSNYPGTPIHTEQITRMILRNEKLLSAYNIYNIIETCKILGIEPHDSFVLQSELIDILPRNSKGSQSIQDIVEFLNGTTYYTGIGGKDYLDERKFNDAGISIVYQNIEKFPPTSIIDVLLTRGLSGILNEGLLP